MISKQFQLKWLMLGMFLCGLYFGAFVALEVYGVVIVSSLLFAVYLFLAPTLVPLHQRVLVLFISAGAIILSWSLLHGFFGTNYVHRWGDLSKNGAWATGVLVGALRFSQLSVWADSRATSDE